MWHTIKLDIHSDNKIYHCHITQKLSEHNQGHYCGYLNDKDGNTIAVIQSNTVRSPLRIEEATELCHQAIPNENKSSQKVR
jgi:hypothetical protein